MDHNRSPVLVFNELSLTEASRQAIETSIPGLASLIRQARASWAGLRLSSPAGELGSLQPVDKSTTFATIGFGGAGSLRDEWRYIAMSADRLHIDLQPDISKVYSFGTQGAIGLGVAAETGHVGFSLLSSDVWAASELSLECESLTDDNDVIVEKSGARHLSSPSQLAVHQPYVDEIREGLPFAEFLAQYCPSVTLIRRVWDSIPNLERSGGVIAPIRARLYELNCAIEKWDPKAAPGPTYFSHVTPESETRKERCTFSDDFGSIHCYEMHARYTPTAGRIHFRLIIDHKGPRLEVGHIGLKL